MTRLPPNPARNADVPHDYAGTDWAWKIQGQLSSLQSQFLTANAALNLFIDSQEAVRSSFPNLDSWERDSQRRREIQHAVEEEREVNLWRFTMARPPAFCAPSPTECRMATYLCWLSPSSIATKAWGTRSSAQSWAMTSHNVGCSCHTTRSWRGSTRKLALYIPKSRWSVQVQERPTPNPAERGRTPAGLRPRRGRRLPFSLARTPTGEINVKRSIC